MIYEGVIRAEFTGKRRGSSLLTCPARRSAQDGTRSAPPQYLDSFSNSRADVASLPCWGRTRRGSLAISFWTGPARPEALSTATATRDSQMPYGLLHTTQPAYWLSNSGTVLR
jgi:hypothetical protein